MLRTAVDRLEDLAAFRARRAAAGSHHVAGHVQTYHDDADWIAQHLEDLRPR